MNSVSVTGKNWILKKFDQEKITYLKDNYSLDEITAFLLDQDYSLNNKFDIEEITVVANTRKWAPIKEPRVIEIKG